MFAQVANLLAIMLGMSGRRKKEACDKLDSFESQLGPAGVTQLVECGGDFVAARKHAIVSCGSVDVLGSSNKNGTDTDDEHMCNIAMCNVAKAQVRL